METGRAKLVKRFNQHGLAALHIAAGAGRKPTYTSEQRTRILAEVQRGPDRQADQTATWSLRTLRAALRQTALPEIAAETIRQALHEAGYRYQRTRTWVRTGYALRVRKSGTVTTYDPETPKNNDRSNWRTRKRKELGSSSESEDEAGPYQAIPQPGESWQPEGHPARHPHEYERGGTAKLLTLFRPATGTMRAKGGVSVTNAVLHPWLKEHLSHVLAEIEQEHPAAALPPEAERPPCAQWETWLGHPPRTARPPLRILLVLDNLAGHLSSDLVDWFFDHGVMPLYTPVGGSWSALLRFPFSAPANIFRKQARLTSAASLHRLAVFPDEHPGGAMDRG